jgi:hypothetical protein
MEIGDVVTYMGGKISVQRRNDGFIAYITYMTGVSATGSTIVESIGKLIMNRLADTDDSGKKFPYFPKVADLITIQNLNPTVHYQERSARLDRLSYFQTEL